VFFGSLDRVINNLAKPAVSFNRGGAVTNAASGEQVGAITDI